MLWEAGTRTVRVYLYHEGAFNQIIVNYDDVCSFMLCMV